MSNMGNCISRVDETQVIESILSTFDMDLEKFNQFNQGSTHFITGFWNGEMDDDCKNLYCYLEGLDGTLPEYLQFGADKAGVNNFKQFCDCLNIDCTQQEDRFSHRGHHLYSADKKLMITYFSSGAKSTGYMHYFGVTGGRQEVLNAYAVFTRLGTHNGMCYGGREFI